MFDLVFKAVVFIFGIWLKAVICLRRSCVVSDERIWQIWRQRKVMDLLSNQEK